MNRSCVAIAAAALLGWLVTAAPCETIGEAKHLADGAMVVVSGVITSAGPGECYVESVDRCSGIWVQASTLQFQIGDAVHAAGVMASEAGERVIAEAGIYPDSTSALIFPLAMNNRSVGGAPFGLQDGVRDRQRPLYVPEDGKEWQWISTGGLNNTGLLIKTWGTVAAKFYSPTNGLHWFLIDDGYRATSDLGDSGIIVYGETNAREGDFVSVTGISSVEPSLDHPNRLVRVIRPRLAGDVSFLGRAEREPRCSFSDEFDAPTLDPRWTLLPGTALISASTEPGWLRIEIPRNTTSKPGLAQPICGDWMLETKLRADFGQNWWAEQSVVMRASWGTLGNLDSTQSLLAPIMAGIAKIRGGLQIWLPGGVALPLEGDTCYFRIIKEGSRAHVSVSLDGEHYSEDYLLSYVPDRCLVLHTTSTDPTMPDGPSFIAYCDYVRFTRLGDGEVQE